MSTTCIYLCTYLRIASCLSACLFFLFGPRWWWWCKAMLMTFWWSVSYVCGFYSRYKCHCRANAATAKLQRQRRGFHCKQHQLKVSERSGLPKYISSVLWVFMQHCKKLYVYREMCSTLHFMWKCCVTGNSIFCLVCLALSSLSEHTPIHLVSGIPGGHQNHNHHRFIRRRCNQ